MAVKTVCRRVACARLEGQRFQRADADRRYFQRQRQPARHRNADAHAGEGARADRDRDRAKAGEARCSAASSASSMTSIRISAWPLPMSRTARPSSRRRSVSKTQAAQRLAAVSMARSFMASARNRARIFAPPLLRTSPPQGRLAFLAFANRQRAERAPAMRPANLPPVGEMSGRTEGGNVEHDTRDTSLTPSLAFSSSRRACRIGSV